MPGTQAPSERRSEVQLGSPPVPALGVVPAVEGERLNDLEGFGPLWKMVLLHAVREQQVTRSNTAARAPEQSISKTYRLWDYSQCDRPALRYWESHLEQGTTLAEPCFHKFIPPII